MINVDHIAQERWRSPLVDADCHAFCQTIYKGIDGEDWTEFYEYYKEMSKAARVKKTNENQKAKALWKMKAVKDRREDFYDPERKDNIVERKKTIGTVGRAPQRPDRGTGQSFEVCGEFVLEGLLAREPCGRWRLPPKCVGEASLGVRLALTGSDG